MTSKKDKPVIPKKPNIGKASNGEQNKDEFVKKGQPTVTAATIPAAYDDPDIQAPIDKLYTTEEVCDLLRISQPTLYRILKDGSSPLKAIKVGFHNKGHRGKAKNLFRERDIKLYLKLKGY